MSKEKEEKLTLKDVITDKENKSKYARPQLDLGETWVYWNPQTGRYE